MDFSNIIDKSQQTEYLRTILNPNCVGRFYCKRYCMLVIQTPGYDDLRSTAYDTGSGNIRTAGRTDFKRLEDSFGSYVILSRSGLHTFASDDSGESRHAGSAHKTVIISTDFTTSG